MRKHFKKIHRTQLERIGIGAVTLVLVMTFVSIFFLPKASAAFPTNTTVLDNFNRSDGSLNGSTASNGDTWNNGIIAASGVTTMNIASNASTSNTSSWGSAYMNATYGP